MTRPFLALALGVLLVGPQAHAEKYLIEFGWDAPDAHCLSTASERLDRLPFHGVVVHSTYATPPDTVDYTTDGDPAWDTWGGNILGPRTFLPMIRTLQGRTFQRLKHNFLRFNVTPGDAHWFSSEWPVSRNAALFAKAARTLGARGILFDTEQYHGKPFSYPRQLQSHPATFEQYSKKVQERGKQFVEAMQTEYPGLTVLMTFGMTLPARDAKRDGRQLSELDYGLLVPFINGMLEGAVGSTTIIDGYEQSYTYRRELEFTRARAEFEYVREHFVEPKLRAQARKHLKLGFGLWLDPYSGTNTWQSNDPARNATTPSQLRDAVRLALTESDSYVWLYNEQPNWWGCRQIGRPIHSDYVSALSDALRGFE